MSQNPYEFWLQQAIGQIRKEFNQMAGGLRQQTAERLQAADQKLDQLGHIARALQVDRAGAGITRIEDLPGRRVPYDLLVDIPIGNNTTSIREASWTVSQEGPYVAVKRFATFQSSFEFQVTEDSQVSRFSGRSFGRYRPIHSAQDIFDAQQNAIVTTSNPMIALATPGAPGLPSSQSSFRTMEFDGRILVENAGSSFPRQNISVPTPFWTSEINSPQELGALDFFERGEVLTFRVQPTHVNNPPAGNVDGSAIFGVTGAWPFLLGQYDIHEGICTPAAFTAPIDPEDDPPEVITSDVVTRLPDGILTLGFLGYRIQQPVGPLG